MGNGKETRRAFLEKRIVVPILIATGATAATSYSTSCQRGPEPNRSELETAIVRGIEETQTATHPDNSPTPSGLAQAMTKAVETPVPQTPTTTGLGTVMTETAITPSVQASTEKPPEGWEIFNSSTLPYKIYYYSEWSVTERIHNMTEGGMGDMFSLKREASSSKSLYITVFATPIDTNITLSNYVKQITNRITAKQENTVTSLYGIEEKIIAGQEAQSVEGKNTVGSKDNPFDTYFVKAMFIANGTGWQITFYSTDGLPEKELSVFNKMLDSFRLVDKVTNNAAFSGPKTPTPAEKQEVKITLNPQDLYRALLTTPFGQDDLPQGFVIEKGPYPFSIKDYENLPTLYLVNMEVPIPDQIAGPFKPIGEVMFTINDPRDDSYGLSFIIFPDSTNAENTFKALSSQPKMRPLDISNLPAVMYAFAKPLTTINNKVVSANTSVFSAVQVGNVLIYAGIIGRIDNDFKQEPTEKIKIQEPNAISLEKAGIKHLQKVGNP